MNEIEKKILQMGIVCGGRSSQRTYENYIKMHSYAKENGYSDINVNFIDPKLEQENKQLKEVIEEVRQLLDKSVVVPDKEGQEELWWTEKYLCCGDELINKFYKILDKAKENK